MIRQSFRNGRVDGVYRIRAGQVIHRTVFNYAGKKMSDMVMGPQGPSGLAKFYYPTGQLWAEGIYKNAWPEGNWVYFHANGRKRSEGAWGHGKSGAHYRMGRWKFYKTDGSILSEATFPGDQNHPHEDSVSWFNDGFQSKGSPEFAIEMLGKLHHGLVKYWHANGRLRKSGQMERYKPVGTFKFFDMNGKAVASEKESWGKK